MSFPNVDDMLRESAGTQDGVQEGGLDNVFIGSSLADMQAADLAVEHTRASLSVIGFCADEDFHFFDSELEAVSGDVNSSPAEGSVFEFAEGFGALGASFCLGALGVGTVSAGDVNAFRQAVDESGDSQPVNPNLPFRPRPHMV